MLKKKIWSSFQRIIELFTKKLSPSSGIKPYSGSRHRIPDTDPQHCLLVVKAGNVGSSADPLMLKRLNTEDRYILSRNLRVRVVDA
jgi:hypothetical protein